MPYSSLLLGLSEVGGFNDRPIAHVRHMSCYDQYDTAEFGCPLLFLLHRYAQRSIGEAHPPGSVRPEDTGEQKDQRLYLPGVKGINQNDPRGCRGPLGAVQITTENRV